KRRAARTRQRRENRAGRRMSRGEVHRGSTAASYPTRAYAASSNSSAVLGARCRMRAVSNHTWTFFRAGGVDQVVLKDAADLSSLEDLDQKLWVALACPTKGNEIDARSLDLIDSDH